MKVKEIIQFYLELKRVNASVPSICEQFGLESYQNTYCINLSGGNKRKLSFALACMCKPRLLLLDEPSTGVDPESRRGMWKNILETSRFNQRFNMILTTHSMEEAEILCDTVSWLKSGSFVSIGNPEKLKLLHSAGYKLHIKFIKLDKDSDNLNNQSVENLAYEIKGLDKFRPLISENMTILPCLSKLSEVLNQIRVNCSDINLLKINKDLSFELAIHVLKAKQSTLFAQILNMKNTNNLISEISVSMESLENILTRL
jgi:ABC-type multidrug transport system ATPase subunit